MKRKCKINIKMPFFAMATVFFFIRAEGKIRTVMEVLSRFRRYFSFFFSFAQSPPNSTPRRFPSYLLVTFLLYFLFIFYHPLCTIPDFPSVSSLASLSFLSCCHRTTYIHTYIIYMMYIYKYI